MNVAQHAATFRGDVVEPARHRARLLLACARWVIVAASWGNVCVQAHDPGISTAQVQLFPDRVELVTGFAPADAEMLLPVAARTGEPWNDIQFESTRDALQLVAPRLWEVQAGIEMLPVRLVRVELSSGDALNFHQEFLRPDVPMVVLRARSIAGLPPGHRQFVIVMDSRGSTITKKLLSVRDSTIEVPLGTQAVAASAESPAASGAPTFWGFVLLGVEHIWTGYDHLLFLLALLVVCRTFRSSVAIISFFTIAHSLTLALATVNLVHLPGKLVEPLIALSIVFVGAENLWRRGVEPRGRWFVTFTFGLIHGFGFASVLRDLGVGRGGEGIAMPLVAFNLGVEAGQLAVAAIVLPLFWQAQKTKLFLRTAVPAISAIVALAGLYWLAQRTILA